MYLDKAETSGEIAKQGGPIIQEMASTYIKSYGPVYFGAVGKTSSGQLLKGGINNVIFAGCPVFG